MEKLNSREYSLMDFYNLVEKQEIGIGIPHFQRGLVWNDELKANLIESLLLGIPIGTFMLWESTNSQEDGIYMCGSDNYQYLIIDGQQRLRTLIDFREKTNKDILDSETELQEETWYINLRLLEEDGAGFVVFKKKRPNTKDKEYLLPINCFSAKNEVCSNNYKVLIKRFDDLIAVIHKKSLDFIDPRAFLKQVINIKILENYNLQKVIHTYIKINSSGKPVKNEEKAYAKFMKLGKNFDNNFNLKELYKIVSADANLNEARRSQLERKPENQFGFDVFIKILLQNFYYHFGFNAKKDKGFEFGRIDDILNYSNVLKNKDDLSTNNKINNIFDHTKQIISFLASHELGIIRNQLKFDDLRFFPDNGFKCIQPLIQLMILFPKSINDDCRGVYSQLALLLLLKDLPYLENRNKKESIVGLISKLNEINHFDKAVALLLDAIRIESSELKGKLSFVDTINNHYIDLLYGLERNLGGRDISILNINKIRRDDFIAFYNKSYKTQISETSQMPPIGAKISPTRQHIIPAIKLTKDRNGRGLLHNIGNITFISDALNTFKGLGQQYMDLGLEKENFQGHCFNDDFEAKYGEYRIHLNSLKGVRPNFNDKAEINKLNHYLILRQNIIANEFLNWADVFRSSPVFQFDKNIRNFQLMDQLFNNYRQYNPKYKGGWFVMKLRDRFKMRVVQNSQEENDVSVYIQADNNDLRTIYRRIKLGRDGKSKNILNVIVNEHKHQFRIPKRIPPRMAKDFSFSQTSREVSFDEYCKLINDIIKILQEVE